jgi:hypothetical protein
MAGAQRPFRFWATSGQFFLKVRQTFALGFGSGSEPCAESSRAFAARSEQSAEVADAPGSRTSEEKPLNHSQTTARKALGFFGLLLAACGGSAPEGGLGAAGAGAGGTGVGGTASISGGATSSAGAGGASEGSSASGGSISPGGEAGGSNSSGGGASTAGGPAGGRGGAGGAGSAGGAQGGSSGVAGKAGNSTGGASTGGSSGGSSTALFPCNGSTAGYNTLMIKSGSTWTVTKAAQQVHSGTDMEAALRAAYGSLTSGRTSKESILVQGSGDIPAGSQVGIPSYTVVNVCGTINVSGTPSGSDRSPLYARNAREIEIPNLKMTGSPQYGIFFRGTNDIHLGQIDLRLTRAAGIGVRVDTSGNAGSDTTFNQNLRIDYVFGSGMSSHIVETYGISNITIGEVEGDDVGECGLLLNRSIKATIDLVTCNNCGVGTGYAAFRMANDNGLIDGGYGTVNIIAKSVVARGGGRGIFSVSGSGAARIDRVDLQDTGNNSILLENAHNVSVGNAAQQSRVDNSGQLRIAGTSSDITIQNIAVSGTTISESPCATNSTWMNVNGAPTNCN